MQDAEEPMGPGQLNWLASIVEDGTASRDEAEQLLVEFVRQVDRGNVMPRMLQHTRDCFAAFLSKKKTLMPALSEGREKPLGVPIATLEKAFGLTRVAPGNPPVDRDTQTEAAMEVLQRRLSGDGFKVACIEVAATRKARGDHISSSSQVGTAWAQFQFEAVQALALARIVEFGATQWTPREVDRLNHLFWGKLWWTPPGADAKARSAAIRAELDDPSKSPEDAAERVEAVRLKYDAPFAPKNPRRKAVRPRGRR